MSESAPAPRQEWRSSLDPKLVARLQQPAARPGVMRQAMLNGVLSRSMRLSNRVPLLGELSRRMGYDTTRGPQTPVVLALPTEPPLPSAPDAPPAASPVPRAAVAPAVQRQTAAAAPLAAPAPAAPDAGASSSAEPASVVEPPASGSADIQRSAASDAPSASAAESAPPPASEGSALTPGATESALPVVSPDTAPAATGGIGSDVEMVHPTTTDASASPSAHAAQGPESDAADAATVEAEPPPRTIARSSSGRFVKAAPPEMPLATPDSADQPSPAAPDIIQRAPEQSAGADTIARAPAAADAAPVADAEQSAGADPAADAVPVTVASPMDAPRPAAEAPTADVSTASGDSPAAEVPTVRGTPSGDALAAISAMPPLRQIRRTPLASAPPLPQAAPSEAPRAGQVVIGDASLGSSPGTVQRTGADTRDAETPIPDSDQSATPVPGRQPLTAVVIGVPAGGDSIQRAGSQPLVDAVDAAAAGDQPISEQVATSGQAAATDVAAELTGLAGDTVNASAAAPGAIQRTEMAVGATGAEPASATSESQAIAGVPVGDALSADPALIHRTADGGEPPANGGAGASAIQRTPADAPSGDRAAESPEPGTAAGASTSSLSGGRSSGSAATAGAGTTPGEIQRSASDPQSAAGSDSADELPVVVGAPAASVDAPISSAVNAALVQREDLAAGGNASTSSAAAAFGWAPSDSASAAEITVAAMMADAQRGMVPGADASAATASPPIVAAVAPAATLARDSGPALVLATGYTAASATTGAPVVTGSIQRTIREGGVSITEEPARRAVVAASAPGAQNATPAAATPLIQRASSSADAGDPRLPVGDTGQAAMPDAIQRTAEPFPIRPPRADEQAMPLAATEAVPESPTLPRSDAGQVSRAGVVSAAAFQAARASGRGARGLPLVQRASAGRGGQAERGAALPYAARETAEARAAFSGAASGLAASAPAMIQREYTPLDDAGSGSGASIPAGPAPEVAAVAPPDRQADGPDVGLIARQVYEILVRRLVSERRQRGW